MLFCCTNLSGEVVIPNGVTTICQNAFGQCRLIESITIPATVDNLGRQVFDNWTNNIYARKNRISSNTR